MLVIHEKLGRSFVAVSCSQDRSMRVGQILILVAFASHREGGGFHNEPF